MCSLHTLFPKILTSVRTQPCQAVQSTARVSTQKVTTGVSASLGTHHTMSSVLVSFLNILIGTFLMTKKNNGFRQG